MKLRQMMIVLCLCAVSAPLAYAGDVRFPEQGNPAFTFHVPDDWSTRIDADGNMILTAGDHTSAFSLSLVEYEGALDDLATDALHVAKAVPPPRRDAASISGYGGYTYYSTMTNDSGAALSLKLIAVRVDGKHVATCTLITADGISQADLATAEAVLDSMKLSASP